MSPLLLTEQLSDDVLLVAAEDVNLKLQKDEELKTPLGLSPVIVDDDDDDCQSTDVVMDDTDEEHSQELRPSNSPSGFLSSSFDNDDDNDTNANDKLHNEQQELGEDEEYTFHHVQDLDEADDENDIFTARRSILKTCIHEPLHISNRKRDWLALPKADLEQVKLLRVDSLGSFLCIGYGPEEEVKILRLGREQECTLTDSTKSAEEATANNRPKSRSVSFSDITIREYDVTIGDNPSVSYGPPIQLDWDYTENKPRCLTDYEKNRDKPRTMRQLATSYNYRQNILVNRWGHSEEEVRTAKNEAKKTKAQRATTRSCIPLHPFEYIAERVGRKAKKVFKRNRSGGCRYVKLLSSSTKDCDSIITKSESTATVQSLEEDFPLY